MDATRLAWSGNWHQIMFLDSGKHLQKRSRSRMFVPVIATIPEGHPFQELEHLLFKYNLSVPVLLAQADGIWHDRIALNLFSGGTKKAIKALAKRVKDANSLEFVRALITPDWPLVLSKEDRPDDFSGLNRHLVSCPGNKLPEFGRRVARLPRRQSAGDLARSASEGNAGRRDESAEEW